MQTDPGLKGNTASGGDKPATIETGAVVTVPLFINIGDNIIVNTDEGTYKSRAAKSTVITNHASFFHPRECAHVMSNARRLIDPIAREAKKLGFVARSALKLSELDVKFSLLRGKSRIRPWMRAGCVDSGGASRVEE